MDIYLLDNQIPLANEQSFVYKYHENPGWNSSMSNHNRGLRTSKPKDYTRGVLYFDGWSYNRHWIKKLIPVEETL